MSKYAGVNTIWTIEPYVVCDPGERADYVKSIDFSHDGKLVLISERSRFKLYDCIHSVDDVNKEEMLTRRCDKYGVGVIRFTSDEKQCVHTSLRGNHDLRLLDYDQNHYISYYKGHTDLVKSLAMATGNINHMLSTGADKQILLWDRRKPCNGPIMTPIVSLKADQSIPISGKFDPTGVIIAILHSNGRIDLHDFRLIKRDKPFISFQLEMGSYWENFEFHPLGKQILASASGPKGRSKHIIMDAFHGSIDNELTDFENADNVAIRASFSPPGGNYIFSGSDDSINIWDSSTGEKELSLPIGVHNGLIKGIYFNPKFPMFLTTGNKCVFFKWKNEHFSHNMNEI